MAITNFDRVGKALELLKAGLMGADVTVTLEIQAQVPAGAPDNIVRTVTENCRTLKFSDHGFEKE